MRLGTPFDRRPTLADIARRCGVSKATVSLALHRTLEESRLRPDTRQRVLAVAKELGYQPDWRGRALAQRRSGAIGLIGGRGLPANEGVYQDLANSVAQAAFDAGYHLVLLPLPENRQRWYALLGEGRLDACVIVQPAPDDLAQLQQRSGIPMATINCPAPAPVTQVLADDLGGATQLARHLLELGHRQIAFLHGETEENRDHYSRLERENAYRAAMAQAGLTPIILTTPPRDCFPRLRRELPEVTAVMAYGTSIALELLQLVVEMGLRVPHDLSIGVCDNHFINQYTAPPLTSVQVPMNAMGCAALRAVMADLEQTQPAEPRTLRLPEQLIVRASTAAPGGAPGGGT